MATTVTVKGKKLVIEMDLIEPRPSSSGKTLVCATTAGAMKTEATVNGKPLTINVNAYIPNK